MTRARALVWVPDLPWALLPRLQASPTEVFSKDRQYPPAQRLLVWGSHLASGNLRLPSRTPVPSWPRHQKIVTLPSRGAAKTPRHPGAAALPAPSRHPQSWDGDSGHLPPLSHPRASRRPQSPVCPSWERCIPAEQGDLAVRGVPAEWGVPPKQGVPAERGVLAGRGIPGERDVPEERGVPLERDVPAG